MLEKIQNIIAERLGLDAAIITAETDLQYDLGIDSLTLVSMAEEVESAFSVTIPDSDLADIVTVGDLAAVIEALLK